MQSAKHGRKEGIGYMIRTLSCHCGNVRLEVNAELKELGECNCSTCARWGMIVWKVPSKAVRLATPSVAMGTYYWRFADEGYHWCLNCGTPMYRTWRDDIISLNARCIEGIDVFDLNTKRGDGMHRIPGGPVPPLPESFEAGSDA